MSKITLTNLVNLQNETTAVSAINANNVVIQTAMDNTLSRDGTNPNTMNANLDMNSHRILNLPYAVSVVEPVTLAQMTAALVANGNINTGLTGVPVSAAMQPVVAASTLASARNLLQIPVPYIDSTLSIYAGGVKADGVTDDTAALQAAVDAAAGVEVRLPSGTIVITSQIHYIVNVPGTVFMPGLKIVGQGPYKTFIDNRVANNSCIYSAGTTAGTYQQGGYLKNFTIITTTSPVNSHGIEHYACYQYLVENVNVVGMTGDGMRITCLNGDPDASNQMLYNTCSFIQCNIGFNCNYSPAVTQGSFFRIDNSQFNKCPIGLRYIGLQGTMVNTWFTEAATVALWFPNNGGSSGQFTSFASSFENNFTSLKVDTLQGGDFIQTEFASGSAGTPIGTQTVLINAGSNINFQGSRIRVGNPSVTMWTLGASAAGIKIRNSFYANFDGVGQTRYSVNATSFANQLDDSCDSIAVGKVNGVASISCINGANENLVLPLDGTMFSITGPSGVFSIGGMTNGFDGRKLMIYNNTGQVMTITSSSGGSAAANQIRTENSTNVTLGNQGVANFVYSRIAGCWNFTGKG